MKRFAHPFKQNESGEIMLESSIILVSVLILLMILLSMCFMFYQQAVMNTVAAELSSALAKNYKYHQADPRAHTFTVDDVAAQKKYRLTLGMSKMETKLEENADSVVQTRLSVSSFGINSTTVDAECEVVGTGFGRAYVKVTVTNDTEFFLSGILKWAGIFDGEAFSATSYSEITDLTAYASTVNFANYVIGGMGPISGIGKIYVNLKDIIDKLIN